MEQGIDLMEKLILRLLPILGLALWLASASVQANDSTPRININTATAAEIAAHLDGIGMAKAEAIIAYRESHGPFSDLQSLGEVKGIGDKTLEKNADRLLFVAPANSTAQTENNNGQQISSNNPAVLSE